MILKGDVYFVKQKNKKLIKYILLTSLLVISILYILSIILGTEIAFVLFGVKNENIVFDKTYKEFAYDVSGQDNIPKNRVILYSDLNDSNKICALHLRYSRNIHRLVKATSLKISDGGIQSKEVNFFSRKEAYSEPFIETNHPYLALITFFRYANDNPEDISGDYNIENLIGNGKESIHLLFGLVDVNEEVSEFNNVSFDSLYSKKVTGNSKYIYLEAIDYPEVN